MFLPCAIVPDSRHASRLRQERRSSVRNMGFSHVSVSVEIMKGLERVKRYPASRWHLPVAMEEILAFC